MKILLICDDYWHPGQVPIDGIAPLRAQGFEFDIISDANDFKPDMLSGYSVVLLVKSDQASQKDDTGWKTEEVQRAFVSYVENGGGLLAVHSGIVAGGKTQTLDNLIGCKFIYHPHDCPVTVQPLKPHPVTEGVQMFCETDEHYRIQILSQDADILIASYSPAQGVEEKFKEDPYNNTPACICPACLVRTQGKGRVCTLTPGHLLPVWLNPQFQLTLSNALRWCAGG
ncbi:MAG: ThuA domain-containing protein [Treponema sp.]|nr:ThuA domain-containing protein [Treponema sp.]